MQAISVYFDQDWDPIGLFGYDEDLQPPAGDEYRIYAVHVLGMLKKGEAAPAISHYLSQQASRTMEVGPSGSERLVAERLHAWFHAGAEPAALSG